MKTAMKHLLAVAAVIGMSLSARATALFTISDGINPLISVSDNGVGDQNPATGAIVVQTNVGVWFLAIDIGVTKPLAGSATSPVMDINLQAESSAGGTLTMQFSDQNFGPASGTVFATTSGFTIDGAEGFETTSVYGDQANNTFGTLPPLSDLIVTSGSQALPSTGANVTATGPLNLHAPFSLTEVLSVNASGATFVNVDGGFSVSVPEPGIPALGALGVAGWAFFRVRNGRRA